MLRDIADPSWIGSWWGTTVLAPRRNFPGQDGRAICDDENAVSPQSAIQIGLYSALVPAATAFAVFFALSWLLSESTSGRYRLSAALALGICAGFAFSPTTKSLWPTQFWEWIPYLGLLAGFAAGLSLAEGVTRGERWIIVLLLAAAAAWTIVPTWERLAEVRIAHVLALAGGIFALVALLEPVADRIAGRGFAFWLMLAAAATGLLIMSEWSETLGRSAAIPAGALAGCGAAMLLAKPGDSPRGLVLPYAVVVGSYAYVGFIYPQLPLTPLAAVPFAPLALWLCSVGPLSRLTGLRAVMVQAICVLVPLIVIAAILLARSGGDEW